jgi:hypothetical protein
MRWSTIACPGRLNSAASRSAASGHPDPVAEALPERAGGGLHTAQLVALRVTGGDRAPLPERLEVLERRALVAGQVQQRRTAASSRAPRTARSGRGWARPGRPGRGASLAEQQVGDRCACPSACRDARSWPLGPRRSPACGWCRSSAATSSSEAWGRRAGARLTWLGSDRGTDGDDAGDRRVLRRPASLVPGPRPFGPTLGRPEEVVRAATPPAHHLPRSRSSTRRACSAWSPPPSTSSAPRSSPPTVAASSDTSPSATSPSRSATSSTPRRSPPPRRARRGRAAGHHRRDPRRPRPGQDPHRGDP